jgi:periplasmic copper chaperone A
VQGKISGIEAGQDLPFKVTQLCGDKGKVSWDEVAAAGVDPHSLKSPAPTIRVAAKSAHAGGHDHSAMDMDVVKAGSLEVSDGTTKAMLPGQPVGGGYVTIKNTGDSDDKLIGVESSSAGRAEIHEMAMVNDVMKMRKLDDGIVIPAGQTVELKPGGLHMMFFDVKKPFAEGDKVPVTLIFEKAGKVEIVLSAGAAKGGGDHQHN